MMHRYFLVLPTPSVDSYYQAMQGKYQLLTLSERVEKKPLPDCEVVDLRSELGQETVPSFRRDCRN